MATHAAPQRRTLADRSAAATAKVESNAKALTSFGSSGLAMLIFNESKNLVNDGMAPNWLPAVAAVAILAFSFWITAKTPNRRQQVDDQPIGDNSDDPPTEPFPVINPPQPSASADWSSLP